MPPNEFCWKDRRSRRVLGAEATLRTARYFGPGPASETKRTSTAIAVASNIKVFARRNIFLVIGWTYIASTAWYQTCAMKSAFQILLLAVLAITPSRATELGIDSAHFTVDGKRTFLLGISYYGALGA